MENTNSLLEQFKETLNTFNALKELLEKRIYDLNDDIECNINEIEIAYNNIKEARNELAEIETATNGFAVSVDEVHGEAEGVRKDADTCINAMYPLVTDGYIDDPDYYLVDENGVAIERDSEDANDFVAPNTEENR